MMPEARIYDHIGGPDAALLERFVDIAANK